MPLKPQSTLSAAADRLDRLVLSVKHQQYDSTGLKGVPQPLPVKPDPEEDWARQFGTRIFTTGGESGTPAPWQRLARRPLAGPDRTLRPGPVRLAVVEPEEKRAEIPQNTGGEGHIGAGLGKAARRKGFLGRLFHGSK